jgi:hypothetical protein
MATILPIVFIIEWQAIYAIFAMLSIFALFFYIVTNQKPKIFFPLLFIFKLIILLFIVIIYLDQPGTVSNILAIISAELIALWLVADIHANIKPSFFSSLVFLCLFNIGFYFFLSVILSAFSGQISNPIHDFLSGNRVRLLSFDTGHSIMIDLSFICLIISLSNIGNLLPWHNVLIFIFSTIALIVTKSGGAFLILGVSIFVFWVEWLPFPHFFRFLFYFPILIFLTIYFLQPGLLEDILLFIRVNLQGANTSAYANNDFTAGRGDLNQILIEFIQTHFWFGGGHEQPIIQYGTNIYSSLALSQESTAVVESSLRNAAKYGMPYLIVIIAFILQPCVTAARTNDRRVKIFCISLSLGLLSLSAVNSQFEVPHEPQHFIYFSLLAISIRLDKAFPDRYQALYKIPRFQKASAQHY